VLKFLSKQNMTVSRAHLQLKVKFSFRIVEERITMHERIDVSPDL